MEHYESIGEFNCRKSIKIKIDEKRKRREENLLFLQEW